MVYRDHWALAQWFLHFAGALGAENLYVIAHGADPEIARICPGASVLTLPRDRLDGFDRIRGQMLNAFQDGLRQSYDWVIRTDADELICLDPALWPDFPSFLAAQSAPAVFALGFDLTEAEDDTPLSPGAPVFHHRRQALFCGHYSKAWAVRTAVGLVRHGVQTAPDRIAGLPFCLPDGAYLAHLKYANLAALDAANHHRRDIAAGPGRGLPGAGWAQADQRALRFLLRAARLPEQEWTQASRTARDALRNDPVRDLAAGLLRARSLTFDFKTRLPDWFTRL